MITEVEQRILETLLELDRAAGQMATANPKPNLLPLFARLETLAQQLPASADRDLLHYLHRKSYQKALALLQARVVA